MILKHYLLRTIKDPMNLVMLILFPIAMISIFTVTSTTIIPAELRTLNGFDIVGTNNLLFNALFFQFFCGMIVTDFLYYEFRTDMRWRLMATPKPLSRFIISAIVASIIISIINGVVVLSFGRFVFNAYFNIPMMMIVLLTTAIFVTLVGVLCFLVFPKKGTTTAVIMVVAFAQMLVLNFNMLTVASDRFAIGNFLPVIAGVLALDFSGGMMIQFIDPAIAWEGGFTELGRDMSRAFAHLAILAGWAVVTGIAVAILGRKRKI